MLQRPRARVFFAVFALIGATAFAYALVTRCGFLRWDDDGYVADNAHVLRGLDLDGVRWAFTTGAQANWHPLTWLSLMATVSAFGASAAAQHVVNVAMHAGASVALFLWLRGLTGAFRRAWLVAALFALHPSHVESVAWIAERKDVQSALFGLLALHAWTGWARRGSRAAYAAAIVLFALGLLSKQMLVTLPCAMLLLDAWPLARLDGTRRTAARLVAEKLPLFALSAGASIATVIAQRASGAVQDLERFTLATRLANAVVSYARYLGLLAWPVDLVAYYPHTRRPAWLAAAAAVALVAAVTALAWRARRTRPWWLVGWLWFLGTLVPVIGVVQVGGQALADRYVYLPSIGPCVVLAWELGALAERGPRARAAVTIAAAGALAVLGALTWRQVKVWRTTTTLFAHAQRIAPSWVSEAHLAMGLADDREWDRARQVAMHALAGRSEMHALWSLVGETYEGEGRLEPAADAYGKAVEIAPDQASYRSYWAIALDRIGRHDEAERQFVEALRLDPDDARAHGNWGTALLRRGRTSQAIAELRQALALDPRDPQLMAQLGGALAATGATDEALGWYDRALAADPRAARVWTDRGALLANAGRFEEAIAAWRRAIALPDPPPEARAHLARIAAALRGAGQPDRAATLEAELAEPR